MPVCLITGASGFLGRHLRDRLAIDRPASELVSAGRGAPGGGSLGEFRPVDLTDPVAVADLIAGTAPSTVFHLAGRTPPATPAESYGQNTLATVHVLDALRAAGRPCRVVLVGSAARIFIIA